MLLGAGCLPLGHGQALTLAGDGVARLPIVGNGSSEAVLELRRYLGVLTGAEFEVKPVGTDGPGILVGLVSNVPGAPLEGASDLGPEGFLIRTDGDRLYLLAETPRGVSHAVASFLHGLGCRWYFPGEAWEVVPHLPTIEGDWNERSQPSFPTQRRIWYGFGAYPAGKRDLSAWERHNRMGGPLAIQIGHTWHGLDPDRDFAAHPEWFALVDGERRPGKPCYSHPEVVRHGVELALERASSGQEMISMTPPDGLGYCECPRCLEVCGGAKPFREHGGLFARRPDGELVSVTSETVFRFVNRVAEAVAARFPGTMIGCYAYSAYSHPPSFQLHPNVYLQTTTAFRRTSLALEEQLATFGSKVEQLGIREYYSVFQWDWDDPDPGKMTPHTLARELRDFRRAGVTAINAEASNNWGARGPGYWLASRLMWDPEADPEELLRDFYEGAFGPASLAMQRYYVRWGGAEFAVLEDPEELPGKRVLRERGSFDGEGLRDCFRDLDAAVAAVSPDSAYRRRIDMIRLYAHYLFLRGRLHHAVESGDRTAILEAIRDETIFGGRLADTHLIHSRALLGKAFLRRFRDHEALLADVPEARQAGNGWRQVGVPPDREELERLWRADWAVLVNWKGRSGQP